MGLSSLNELVDLYGCVLGAFFFFLAGLLRLGFEAVLHRRLLEAMLPPVELIEAIEALLRSLLLFPLVNGC